ncbi:hypothetical protein HDU67_004970, partial [Dinochytrium kinnereticum]
MPASPASPPQSVQERVRRFERLSGLRQATYTLDAGRSVVSASRLRARGSTKRKMEEPVDGENERKGKVVVIEKIVEVEKIVEKEVEKIVQTEVEKIVEKEVEKIVVVEKEVEKEVEKIVVVEKEVEKFVEVP